MRNLRAPGLAGRPRTRPAYSANLLGQDRTGAPLYSTNRPAEMTTLGPRVEQRLDSKGALSYGGARARTVPRSDSAVAWLLRQTECFLSAGFVPAGVGQARPGRQAFRLSGPDEWLVTALQTHVIDWEIAVRYGAAVAVPNSFVPGPAGSEARG